MALDITQQGGASPARTLLNEVWSARHEAEEFHYQHPSLDDFVSASRAEGMSWRMIERALVRLGLPVVPSPETIAAWYAEPTLERT